MVLTSAANHHNTFRIRSVDAGDTGLNGSGLQTAGRLANDVWKFDGSRSDFFQRFSEGIRIGQAQGPRREGRTSEPRRRSPRSVNVRSCYLKFADKGTKVSFDERARISPPKSSADISEYFPD